MKKTTTVMATLVLAIVMMSITASAYKVYESGVAPLGKNLIRNTDNFKQCLESAKTTYTNTVNEIENQQLVFRNENRIVQTSWDKARTADKLNMKLSRLKDARKMANQDYETAKEKCAKDNKKKIGKYY